MEMHCIAQDSATCCSCEMEMHCIVQDSATCCSCEMEMHCIAQYGAESTTTFQSLTLFYYVKSYSEWYRWAVSLNHCCHWQLTVVLMQSEKSYHFSGYCDLRTFFWENIFCLVLEIKLWVKNFVTSSHISGKSRKTLSDFKIVVS